MIDPASFFKKISLKVMKKYFCLVPSFSFPSYFCSSQYILLRMKTQEFKGKDVILLHRNHDLHYIVKTR